MIEIDNIKELAKKLKVSEKSLIRRADSRIEWICEHGVGHPMYVPQNSNGVHGCCGCCKSFRK